MRKEDEVIQAEQKYFELFWLDRHTQYIEPEITKKLISGRKLEKEEVHAVIEAEKIRKKYAGDINFESWKATNNPAFIAGKLSALRWVLGDEWDDLDT